MHNFAMCPTSVEHVCMVFNTSTPDSPLETLKEHMGNDYKL